ncbi:hypothetical protein ACWIG5_21755 [Streptomyces lydicus]
MATHTDDHIFSEPGTSRLHREHIVLHEVGHLLFNHRSLASVSGDDILGDLLTDLNPHTVQRLLARTDYTTYQEQEAEMFASVIQSTAVLRGHGGRSDGGLGDLEAAMGVNVTRYV